MASDQKDDDELRAQLSYESLNSKILAYSAI